MELDESRSNVQWLIVLVGLLCVAAAVCAWTILSRSDIARRQTSRQIATDADTAAQRPSDETPGPDVDALADSGEAPLAKPRKEMVDRQLAGRDITNRQLLAVMRRIPRHEFVPEGLRGLAYSDRPLPIGHDQTISQPYIVALMTQLVRPKPDSRALDIGTGSGYQAAVLAKLVKKVYSVEIIDPLADSARERLKRLGYTNVEVICGDGYQGLPQQAPFDVIIVAAAPDHVPEPLVQQLAPGGRLVLPVGRYFQNLLVIKKLNDGTVRKENVAPVAFVPMTGEAQEKRDR